MFHLEGSDNESVDLGFERIELELCFDREGVVTHLYAPSGSLYILEGESWLQQHLPFAKQFLQTTLGRGSFRVDRILCQLSHKEEMERSSVFEASILAQSFPYILIDSSFFSKTADGYCHIRAEQGEEVKLHVEQFPLEDLLFITRHWLQKPWNLSGLLCLDFACNPDLLERDFSQFWQKMHCDLQVHKASVSLPFMQVDLEGAFFYNGSFTNGAFCQGVIQKEEKRYPFSLIGEPRVDEKGLFDLGLDFTLIDQVKTPSHLELLCSLLPEKTVEIEAYLSHVDAGQVQTIWQIFSPENTIKVEKGVMHASCKLAAKNFTPSFFEVNHFDAKELLIVEGEKQGYFPHIEALCRMEKKQDQWHLVNWSCKGEDGFLQYADEKVEKLSGRAGWIDNSWMPLEIFALYKGATLHLQAPKDFSELYFHADILKSDLPYPQFFFEGEELCLDLVCGYEDQKWEVFGQLEAESEEGVEKLHLHIPPFQWQKWFHIDFSSLLLEVSGEDLSAKRCALLIQEPLQLQGSYDLLAKIDRKNVYVDLFAKEIEIASSQFVFKEEKGLQSHIHIDLDLESKEFEARSALVCGSYLDLAHHLQIEKIEGSFFATQQECRFRYHLVQLPLASYGKLCLEGDGDFQIDREGKIKSRALMDLWLDEGEIKVESGTLFWDSLEGKVFISSVKGQLKEGLPFYCPKGELFFHEKSAFVSLAIGKEALLADVGMDFSWEEEKWEASFTKNSRLGLLPIVGSVSYQKEGSALFKLECFPEVQDKSYRLKIGGSLENWEAEVSSLEGKSWVQKKGNDLFVEGNLGTFCLQAQGRIEENYHLNFPFLHFSGEGILADGRALIDLKNRSGRCQIEKATYAHEDFFSELKGDFACEWKDFSAKGSLCFFAQKGELSALCEDLFVVELKSFKSLELYLGSFFLSHPKLSEPLLMTPQRMAIDLSQKEMLIEKLVCQYMDKTVHVEKCLLDDLKIEATGSFGSLWKDKIGMIKEGSFSLNFPELKLSLEGILEDQSFHAEAELLYFEEKVGGSLKLHLADGKGFLQASAAYSKDCFDITRIYGDLPWAKIDLKRSEESTQERLVLDGALFIRDALGYGSFAFGQVDLFGKVAYDRQKQEYATDGWLRGKDIEYKGYSFKNMDADFSCKGDSGCFTNIKLVDPAVMVSIPAIHFAGKHVSIPLFEVRDFYPCRIKTINKELQKLTALAVPKIQIENLSFTLFEKESLKGKGSIHFISPLAKSHPVLEMPMELIKRIGLDTNLLIPVEGEICFALGEGMMRIEELKECYGEDKRSQFYLTGQFGYIDFDGRIFLDFKVKQHVLLRLAHPFTIAVRGSIEKPTYELY